MGEVVVVTGASAGVGRAVVREFAKKKADIGLIARGVERLEEAKREVEECGGRALVIPADVADAEAEERAAERVEGGTRPERYMGERPMTTVFAPFSHHARGIQARHGSALSRVRVRHHVGAKSGCTRGTAGPWCRLGRRWRIVRFPSIGILRCEACRRRLYRFNPIGADSREKRRAHHGCAPAGDEYTAVLVVPLETSAPAAARAADLCAGSCGSGHLLGCASPAPGTVHRASDGGGHLRPAVRARVRGQVSGRERLRFAETSDPVPPDRPDNLFEPAPGNWDSRGIFTDRASNSSPQAWMDTRPGTRVASLAGLGQCFRFSPR